MKSIASSVEKSSLKAHDAKRMALSNLKLAPAP